MANPNPSPKTRFQAGNRAGKAAAGSKGGKVTQAQRANYASLKECFKKRMTPEMMDKAFDHLWNAFIKHNNLNAYDRLVDQMDDEENTASEFIIKFADPEMDEYAD